MKKYILASATLLTVASFTACNDMLDTDPRVTEMTQATFPGLPSDVEALNAGTYSIMSTMVGGDSDTSNPFYWWEVMSDNCYGSGGLQDNKVKSLHHLVQMDVNQYEKPFILLYGGIGRANNQIETIDNVPWTDENRTQRNQLLGEAYFMRGLYTLWLTQLFGDVPLITSTTITPEMEEQASAENAIYPQILSDFISAKNLMSATKKPGHADMFAAEAFIARAYMFWAGFYKGVAELKNGGPEISLVSQEGCEAASLSQGDVVKGLVDIVEHGGYKLCDDYRSLWQYSNSLLWNEANDYEGHAYKFIADMDPANCFDMPGMGNGNTESIFQIQFMNASAWAIGDGAYTYSRGYSNYMSCFWGLRCNGDNGKRSATYPFNQGWGQGTPSCNIWEDWTAYEATNAEGVIACLCDEEHPEVKGDIRKLGSMIDCVNELENYTFEKDDCEESGYSVKKFNSVCLDACNADLDTWWTKAPGYAKSSLDNSMQGDHFEDFYLMRYADVLLMLTELTGDASYMNQVQARAGVKQTAYSLKAVQDERRWEFAFEGLRFNDMRRWTGNKPTETSYAPAALQAQSGKVVTVRGTQKVQMAHMTSSWTKRYIATNGFLAKPQSQIALMEGKLLQNDGWDGSDETKYKTIY